AQAKAAERMSSELAAQAYLFDAVNPTFDSRAPVADAAAAVTVAAEKEVPTAGLLSRLSMVVVPLVQVQQPPNIVAAVFSPDGARIGTASVDTTARVWDARTGTSAGAPLQHADGVNSAVFSPDGTRVATASADGTARVWDARTGAPVGAPLHHASPVNSAVF